MAKKKYNAKTFPRLAKDYARRGYTDEQAAAKLGISKGTFYNYIKQYPAFKEALEEGKAPVDVEVEDAILKRALGYEFTEVKTTVIGDKVVKTEKTTKHIPANSDSAKFWLINRRPENWKLKQEITHELQNLSEEDLAALARKIIKGE